MFYVQKIIIKILYFIKCKQQKQDIGIIYPSSAILHILNNILLNTE